MPTRSDSSQAGRDFIDPKDVMERLSVDDLCATAEAYYRTIVDPVPQLGKPFGSVIEAPQMLRNIGLLLSGLHLGKTMTVLDFAAGTCWFSRFLHQLQCQTISTDVSETALELGRRLFREHPIVGEPIAEPRFLHFDGRRIDLPDASVERVVCFDAFHHVPNQEEVLSELARVLVLGGIAGFSEPGRSHSRSPHSQFEMENYDVLENDIRLEEVAAMALRVGFTDFRCKVLSDMELSLGEYEAIVGEGLAWKLKRSIVSDVRNTMVNRSIFFLHKGPLVLDSRGTTGLACELRLQASELRASRGEPVRASVQVKNTGSARWLRKNLKGYGRVQLGAHLYDEVGTLLDLDFARSPLERDVEPGESLEWEIALRFEKEGRYRVKLDLVAEWISWFESLGASPVAFNVEVD